MPALTNQPKNPNFLSQNKFRFILQRTPNLVFFGTSARIPDITLLVADQPSAFGISVPIPGHKMVWGDFQYTFKVDEDLANYLEIYKWMESLGLPDNFELYPHTKPEIYSDATLTLLTSKHNGNVEFRLEHIFPINLAVHEEFTNDTDETIPVTATVTFKIRRFYVERIRE